MADASRRAPERTCIGCRRVCSASELVRLSAETGRVAVARPGRAGRGAWVHPEAGCLEAAHKSRAFARAFRRAIEPPFVPELLAAVAEARRGPRP